MQGAVVLKLGRASESPEGLDKQPMGPIQVWRSGVGPENLHFEQVPRGCNCRWSHSTLC